jgi:hypothetical protein
MGANASLNRTSVLPGGCNATLEQEAAGLSHRLSSLFSKACALDRCAASIEVRTTPSPDFLSGFVGSGHYMRFSLKKAAHATVGGAVR